MITGKGAAAAVVRCSLSLSEGCAQAATAAFEHVPGGALMLAIQLANSCPSLSVRSSEKFIYPLFFTTRVVHLNSSQKNAAARIKSALIFDRPQLHRMLSYTAIAQTWQPATLRPKTPLAARFCAGSDRHTDSPCFLMLGQRGLFFLFVALSRGVLGKEGASAAPSLNDFSANWVDLSLQENQSSGFASAMHGEGVPIERN